VLVTPDRVGTYNVVCTELCGFGHATMRALVRVVPPDQYDSWLKRQPLVKPTAGSSTGSSTGTESGESTTTTSPSTTTGSS
jgi:cytochrome c oxidase subunit 2